MKTPIDCNGEPIEVGCLVAYNLSGTIALGKILTMKEIRTRWAPCWSMNIEKISGHYHPKTKISKISNHFNVMVINKDLLDHLTKKYDID